MTIDALHAPNDTADLIVVAGGDYVFTINKNRPSLHAACKNLPWSKVPVCRASDGGRGLRVSRTIAVLAVAEWIVFPGAARIAKIRRTVTRRGRGLSTRSTW